MITAEEFEAKLLGGDVIPGDLLLDDSILEKLGFVASEWEHVKNILYGKGIRTWGRLRPFRSEAALREKLGDELVAEMLWRILEERKEKENELRERQDRKEREERDRQEETTRLKNTKHEEETTKRALGIKRFELEEKRLRLVLSGSVTATSQVKRLKAEKRWDGPIRPAFERYEAAFEERWGSAAQDKLRELKSKLQALASIVKESPLQTRLLPILQGFFRPDSARKLEDTHSDPFLCA